MLWRSQPETDMTGTDVALLEGMLAIPSVTGDEHRLGEWLLPRLTDLGFDARRDSVGNVIGVRGSGERELMLLGHMDTVPGDIPVRTEGDLLYGRGSVDAKGPLAAAIVAAHRLPIEPDRRITVIAAVEEEGDSRGARHLAARPSPAQLVILEPSGWEGITLGYKGSLRVSYRLAQEVAHGAGRHPSAADRLVAFIQSIRELIDNVNHERSLFQRLDFRVIGVNSESDGMEDTATALLGFRVPPGCNTVDLWSRLESWSDGAVLEQVGSEPPVRAEKSTPHARRFMRAIRAAGGEPRFKLKTGTSDMNILAPAWGCPSVAYGPGEAALDHTPHEHVDVREWSRGVDVLAGALATL
jgi:LysW-gamma-L-lysine carboxypeptidase